MIVESAPPGRIGDPHSFTVVMKETVDKRDAKTANRRPHRECSEIPFVGTSSRSWPDALPMIIPSAASKPPVVCARCGCRGSKVLLRFFPRQKRVGGDAGPESLGNDHEARVQYTRDFPSPRRCKGHECKPPNHRVHVLETLVEAIRDSQELFLSAAEDVKNPAFKNMFRELAVQSDANLPANCSFWRPILAGRRT